MNAKLLQAVVCQLTIIVHSDIAPIFVGLVQNFVGLVVGDFDVCCVAAHIKD